MADPVITNLDSGQIAIQNPEFSQEVITFAGADVLAPGTILARDSVSFKLVIFVKGGATNENGIPKAVLTYEVTSTGAGDVPVSALISGQVNRDRLIIDADGDGSNIDNVVLDELRDYSITTQDVAQLAQQDNQ